MAAIFRPVDDAERPWLTMMVAKANAGKSPMARMSAGELLARAASMRDVVEASGSGMDDLDKLNAAETSDAS
jgi:hypothetical protein